jgi:hypothetical protein
MMGVTQAHAKPEGGAVKDCTSIMSELRIIKDDEEIERIKTAAKVAENGVRAAIEAIRPQVSRRARLRPRPNMPCVRQVPKSSGGLMYPRENAQISPTEFHPPAGWLLQKKKEP